MNQILSNVKGDRWIWLIVILLSVLSLLAVYSSTGTLAYKQGKAAELILMKHLFMIVGGIALMYFSHLLDYRYYAGISKILMVLPMVKLGGLQRSTSMKTISQLHICSRMTQKK